MNINGFQQALAAGSVQRPSATDITSKIMGKADVNGDSALSVDELSGMGRIGEKIGAADSNGDGLVTNDELVNKITEQMETMMAGGLPGLMSGDMPSISQLKSMMAEMAASFEEEGEPRSSSDMISSLLDKLQVSDEDSQALLDIFNDSGFNAKA